MEFTDTCYSRYGESQVLDISSLDAVQLHSSDAH